MKRNISLDEISDGKLYNIDDLVEASCNGCKGAAACCHRMGGSIILDPYDIFRLTGKLNKTFEELLAGQIELNVVDGVILPNLRMTGEFESCAFLNDTGKCNIHESRPGICRIFPLGRYYEDRGFQYFLQVNECSHHTRTKVKISNWIDTPDFERNEKFLCKWHYFLNDAELIIQNAGDDTLIKNINMYILNQFYVKKYDRDLDFYIQFNRRLWETKKLLNI